MFEEEMKKFWLIAAIWMLIAFVFLMGVLFLVGKWLGVW